MNSRTKIGLYFLTGLLMIVLSACSPAEGIIPGTGGTQPPGGETSLANTSWRLVSFGEEGAETPVQEGTEITLIFDDAGEVGGSGGCNTYGGVYEVFDSSISVDQIVQTLMACTTEGVTEQETAYLDALENAGEFERSGNQLTIWYNDGQRVMIFEPMEMNSDQP